MARLFLIRRNLESFVGPMTAVELKEAYKRMDFGLADEVSGHCGPWVQLDNVDLLKQRYPDIARFVTEGIKGWGVSNHEPQRIEHGEATRRVFVANGKNGVLAFTFLAIAALAFAAAVYIASGSRMSGRAKAPEFNPQPEEAQGFLDHREYVLFDRYMEDNTQEIIARMTKQKKLETSWLPYLRYYAFTHEGIVPGLSPKLLRGTGAASAPIECSLKAWRQRWRSSLRSWNTFVTERRLVRAHWARILAWDPHWIRRREHKGWIDDQNYYVGCLQMADKALSEMYSDTSLVQVASDWEKLGINKIKQRIQWLQEVTRTGSSNLKLDPIGDQPLAVWSCMEGARDLRELQKCRAAVTGDPAQDPWLSYTDERFGWSLVRIASTQKGSLAPELVAPLGAYATKAGKADYFTRFDYRAEQKLLKTLVKESKTSDKPSDKPADKPAAQPVEKIVEKVYAEFPGIDDGA